METGLIGLPLAGKTTIFNAVTGRNAATSSYAGGKKGTNLAEINVPDTRVDELDKIFKPKRKVYAKVTVNDFPIEFDDHGGITSASMEGIRNLSAMAIVVRAFEAAPIAHPSGKIDPAVDLGRLLDSLVFSDYAAVEKRMQRLEKEAKKATREFQILEKLADKLLGGAPLGQEAISEADAKSFSGFSLLTTKPVAVVLNTGEKTAGLEGIEKKCREMNLALFPLRGDLEMEIAQLEEKDQKEFLADLGTQEPAMNRFLQFIYKTLHLISFLTVGEDEVRAWSIRDGLNAQKAAGKIHSDLEKGFIRAEVVPSAELLTLGGLAEARRAGKLRQEGKDYIVKDGDVLNILFNV